MNTHAECGNGLCGDCYSDGWDAGEKRIADLEQKLTDLRTAAVVTVGQIRNLHQLESIILYHAIKRSRQ